MRKQVDETLILDLNKRFHDEVEAISYDQRMGASHSPQAVKRMIDELEFVLGEPLPRGGRVVDMAAGTGNVAVKLALTGWYDDVTAVDISINSLEKARDIASALGKTITIMQSDMIQLPFDDNSIDLIVGCAFLHHLPDPVAFMCDARRVLKSGGRLIIIGEPTSFGMTAIKVTKLPLVLINRLIRAFRMGSKDVFRWDHDNIDVHSFTQPDADQLLEGFEHKRKVIEGFAEPIVDQGILTPVRLVVGQNSAVAAGCRAIGKALAFADRVAFNRVVPRSMKVHLKISGRKP